MVDQLDEPGQAIADQHLHHQAAQYEPKSRFDLVGVDLAATAREIGLREWRRVTEQPGGSADHDGRAFAPSTVIINGTTGAVLTTINNVGFVDQTWYNPGDNSYYLGARDMPTGPVLGVIDAGSRQWLQNVPTNGNAHSVAADPINNHIFVPLPSGGTNCQNIAADGCVGVYAAQ